MSKIILVGFGWALAFAISFVALGYPTLLALICGAFGGWSWSTVVKYWKSEDEPEALPSYLDDIEILRQELRNIGTGGRIDLHKAQRRRDAKAARIERQMALRQEQLRHRGRPTTMRDHLVKLKSQILPKKQTEEEREAALDNLEAQIDLKKAQIDALARGQK